MRHSPVVADRSDDQAPSLVTRPDQERSDAYRSGRPTPRSPAMPPFRDSGDRNRNKRRNRGYDDVPNDRVRDYPCQAARRTAADEGGGHRAENWHVVGFESPHQRASVVPIGLSSASRARRAIRSAIGGVTRPVVCRTIAVAGRLPGWLPGRLRRCDRKLWQ